ncbi:UDP-glycosyltransferase 90A1-like [Sesamum indicum]|uniref:UDP-glycosyltransferase 90A1-like n=1 Tax=Sesamum indicum TaxID=4182 RepID=A0A6I9SX14_SESIN|nr:UDP-glycosyltransferase 90A1-like [Sesamum indicum]
MQKSFEQALESLTTPVSCVISDGFLGWTLKSAKKFGVPRFVFFGTGNFSFTMYQILGTERPHAGTNLLDEPFPMPDFPGLKLTRNDFDPPYNDMEPSGPYVEFLAEQMAAAAMSDGIIVNSFYELEQCYADYWNNKYRPKALCVGPLCMAASPPSQALANPSYTQFLDENLAAGEPVLYVAFGTQAEVSAEQLQEIAAGLEQSQVSFLWTLKPKGLGFLQKFEERVNSRGIVVKDWVDQQQILRHEGVKGFLSHCGWNSVMESIFAGVPILALPFMAEQHMNARFVAEEAGVGLRIVPRSGSVRGFVAAEEVERKVRELMMGVEKGAEVRKKVAEYRDAACDAVKEGGSSTRTLDMLIDEVARKRQTFSSGGRAVCCPDGQRLDSDHNRQQA